MQAEDELTAKAEAAGAALGDQVNRIANAGAKVLISTVPDLGLTPFAGGREGGHTDIDRSALLTRLTARLNAEMRATILNDGRMIGLILTDEYFQIVQRTAGGGGFTNVLTPVCDLGRASAAVGPRLHERSPWSPAAAGHLALGRHDPPGFGGQAQLGSLALTRAANNPF